MAEVLSLKMGLILASEMCFTTVEADSNCLELIQALLHAHQQDTFFNLHINDRLVWRFKTQIPVEKE